MTAPPMASPFWLVLPSPPPDLATGRLRISSQSYSLLLSVCKLTDLAQSERMWLPHKFGFRLELYMHHMRSLSCTCQTYYGQ